MRSAGARVLVLNAGSSSFKFAVFEGLRRLWGGQIEVPSSTTHVGALGDLLGALSKRDMAIDTMSACGHRVVHGGTRFSAPTLIDAERRSSLGELRSLAPLHNGPAIDALDAICAAAPHVPQIACFDTAFHSSVPEVESRYALPATLHAAGYRRFGFHGLNFEHVTAAVAEHTGGVAPPRLLILHLGNGCSLCAVKGGASIATTMGYSTLDGLVMGTRCGSIDPGVLLALQRDRAMTLEQLEHLCYRQSGLLAVSGRSSDMRELLRIDDAACRGAVEHFCYWVSRHAGSMAAALGGIDAVAFTGGIGAGSASVRAQIAAHMEWLGLDLDLERNVHQEAALASGHSRCKIWRIEANEELAIARHLRAMIRAPA